MKIRVETPGASIYLDGEKVGEGPMDQEIEIDEREHSIRIAKEGYDEKTFAIGPKENLPDSIALERQTGRVDITTDKNALITIDGKAVAVGRYQGTIPAGGVSLKVTADGMRTYQTDLVVRSGEARSLEIRLEPASSGRWLWIAGGAVALVALGTAGYFVANPTIERPQPIMGTIDTLEVE